MLSPAQPTNNPSELRIKLLRLLSYSAEGRRAARKRSRKSHSLGGSLEISTFSYSSEIFFRFTDRAFFQSHFATIFARCNDLQGDRGNISPYRISLRPASGLHLNSASAEVNSADT